MKSQPIRYYVIITAVLASIGFVLASSSVSADLLPFTSSNALVTRTWDGGGATNNWSEAANWSGDVAPGAADAIVFDGTSTKNAVLDTSFSVSSLQIIAGYNGTISQGSSNLTVAGIYEQLNGTYAGGTGVLAIGSTFTLNGGTFTAPSGTLNFPAFVTVGAGATFIPNGGTVAFVGGSIQGLSIPDGFAFNNVIFNKSDNAGVTLLTPFTLIVNGTLNLSDGLVDRNSLGAIDARGDVLIAPSFDGGTPGVPAFLNITGSAVRTVTFPVGAKMLPLTVNAPNTTLNFSGTGTFTFPQNVDVQNAASFSNGAVNVVADSHFATNGFTQGSGSLTCNFDFTQTGGTFEVGSGSLTFNSNFTVSAGTFNAPAGILNFPGRVTVSAGAVFNHNNGTIVFNGTTFQVLFVPAGAVFPLNNVVLNKAHNTTLQFASSGTMTVLGTLTLTEGGMDLNSGGTKIDIQGDLLMAPAFDGAPAGSPITLQISGPATRTVSFPVGAVMLPLIVNAPNVTLNTTGTGTFSYSSVDLQSAASFTNGSVNTVMNGPVNLASATFTQGTGDLAFLSSYTQTAGTFTASSGALDFNGPYILNGGTFTAPAGVVSFGGEVRFLAAATFNPNLGTVVFDGTGPQSLFIPPTFTLNNVTVNKAHNTSLFWFNSPTTLVVAGSLILNDGQLERNSNGSLDAEGSVTVGPNFDGGAINNFRFTGAANQTFNNHGGVNPGATWRVNKSSGTVTAASNLLIPNQNLSIESGTLYLNENSNLSVAALSLGAEGKLINDSATTITLGGNVVNAGTIDLNGGGADCPGTDSIMIRSTDTTQRSWTGGNNRLIDVDVQDMGGTGIKRVFSGTDSGGNSANWVFDDGCPSAVSIAPGVAGVPAGEAQIFTVSGGVAPYTFSILVNNSGATIDESSGVYTAGATLGAVDTVRVTDSFGSTADATANVTGIPVRLAFTVQPSDSSPGQAITPAVTVATQDANGNLVTTIRPPVALSIANNPSGGTLSGTLTKQITNGIAVFDDLSINLFGNGYALQAANVALQTGTSNPFNVRNAAGIPTRLAFVAQPSDTTDGFFYQMRPVVEVAVVDDFGTIVPNVSTSITLSPPAGNPNGLTIFGGEPQPTNGSSIASFSLFVSGIGSGHTIVATASGFGSATSVPFTVHPPTTVFSTSNTGPGSLREAIEHAGAVPTAEVIEFNIPGAPPYIISSDALPSIAHGVTIDATTQPSYAGSPLVELRNANPIQSGIGFLLAGDSTVKGLAITGFAEGIRVGGLGNKIEGNYIGTNLAGNAASPHTIGIQLSASCGSIIGGADLDARNVISGNLQYGILSFGGDSINGDLITGNLIGTDATGAIALPNRQSGIRMFSPVGFTISNNVISGNLHAGIHIYDGDGGSSTTPANIIQHNIIGMDSGGANVVGNGRQGVLIELGSKNDVTQNRIFGNGRLGIQLGQGFNSHEFPPLPNNPGDLINGGFGNSGQNYPVLDSAVSEGGTTTISGSLNTRANQPYRLEFFSCRSCDASGNGEGETFIGSTSVTPGNDGIASFVAVLPVTVANARFISSTATAPGGDTSEFSNCTVVGGRYSISGRVQQGATTIGLQNAVVHVTGSNGVVRQTLTDGGGSYSLTGLPNADYTVTVSKPNHTFSPPSRTYTNLLENHVLQNFGGTVASATLSGQVTTISNGNSIHAIKSRDKALLPPVPAGGFPLFGVTFNLTGAVNRSITNDSFGNYRFDGLPNGTYLLTPSKPNYVFSPPTATVTIAGANQTTLFTAQSLGLSSLSGRVVNDSVGNINAMNADGSGVVTLARANSRTFSHSSPRLSADGAKIVYASRSTTNTNSRLITANADGSGSAILLQASTVLLTPVFSRDRSRIAFNDSQARLLTMNSDGSNVRPEVGRCSEPDWSPDGTRIVCLENETSATRVKVVDLATGGQALLDTSPGTKFSPRWSPDGTKIAFIRRQAGSPATYSIVVRRLAGGIDNFMVGANNLFDTLAWSPDGTRLLFTRDSVGPLGAVRPPAGNKQLVTIQASDGQNLLLIVDGFRGGRIDWSNSNTVATPGGIAPEATMQFGAVTITLPGVSGPDAFTTVTPIEPNSVGAVPTGFVLGSQAFEVNTTATFTPPASICIDLGMSSGVRRQLRGSLGPVLLHNDSGTLVNITTFYDEATGILCGESDSFSPFVVAEAIDPTLASISGLVLDENGDPLDGVSLDLTGVATATTQTDSNGFFTFANLENGANYNVQPHLVGYLFTANSKDFVGVSGENSVIFNGAASTLTIAGRVVEGMGNSVPGVVVDLNGATSDQVVTGADGSYIFVGLPADGSYFITPSNSGFGFSPSAAAIGGLITDVAGVNFIQFAPTAASVSVSGRVMSAQGYGIGNITVSIVGPNGNARSVRTNPFGYYYFGQVEVGLTYLVSVRSSRYEFEVPTRSVSVNEDLTDVDFTALPE